MARTTLTNTTSATASPIHSLNQSPRTWHHPNGKKSGVMTASIRAADITTGCCFSNQSLHVTTNSFLATNNMASKEGQDFATLPCFRRPEHSNRAANILSATDGMVFCKSSSIDKAHVWLW